MAGSCRFTRNTSLARQVPAHHPLTSGDIVCGALVSVGERTQAPSTTYSITVSAFEGAQCPVPDACYDSIYRSEAQRQWEVPCGARHISTGNTHNPGTPSRWDCNACDAILLYRCGEQGLYSVT